MENKKHEKNALKFDCDMCGTCCRSVRNSVLHVDLDRGDGICKNYDDKTHLCKIYNDRPLLCNVDAYYDKFLTNLMTRKKFYELNHRVCKKLKLEAIGHDV